MFPFRLPPDADPPRIAPLAVLPVFIDLAGRRCIVAGGDNAAAWKAELLAAAGAEVHVFAPEPSDEMRGLIDRGASAGSLHMHDRPWCAPDFTNAALAVAIPDAEERYAAFAAAARAAGVPVNIADRPGLSDVRFGAIVNRSPVVVGISTGGASPVLAQAIRRRIETLLPASVADWAAAARRMRDGIKHILPSAGARHHFWERFAETALIRPADRDAEARLLAEAETLSREPLERGRAGSVTLVGAGPGDPELLTVRAIRAMQAADVILFDDLVAPAILEFARREAKRTIVGKRGCRQDGIDAMMVGLARQGNRVVRLTGGDPAIFGRAGEEIAALAAAGIPVNVVPGVAAAAGAAARPDVSPTRRDHAEPDTQNAPGPKATAGLSRLGSRRIPPCSIPGAGERPAPSKKITVNKIFANLPREIE